MDRESGKEAVSFGPKRKEVAGGGGNGEYCVMRTFITCMLHQILLGLDDGVM
jgi:hypothetical protein